MTALTKFKNLTMSSKGDREKWDNKIGGINHSHIHVKEIYTNRKFRGIDKSGVYKLKPGVGHCPMAGVPLIFPVHSWHQRKNTMK
ncbi:hypothetical protein RDI58_003308 [Solanum bulbocastanum]|uniref:Uncharacterized protein n=1 Tax=Solanum bulbocastanum TaxID=147425 RepID=A0AAN8UB01_SOLBU